MIPVKPTGGALRAVVEPLVTNMAGVEHTEYPIWLRLPSAGGDGAMIAVTETRAAADEICRLLQRLIDCEKGWQRVISPNGTPQRW